MSIHKNTLYIHKQLYCGASSQNRHLPFVQFLQNAISLPFTLDVSDVGIIRESGNDLVAAKRGFPGDASRLFAEGRQEQDASSIEGGAAVSRNSHRINGPTRANDDGLLAPEQDLQAVFLDRRVKSTDDGDAFLSEAASGIMSAQNSLSRCSGGAEERRLAIGKVLRRTDSGQSGRSALAQAGC